MPMCSFDLDIYRLKWLFILFPLFAVRERCLCASFGSLHSPNLCHAHHRDEDKEHRHHQNPHLSGPHRRQLPGQVLAGGQWWHSTDHAQICITTQSFFSAVLLNIWFSNIKTMHAWSLQPHQVDCLRSFPWCVLCHWYESHTDTLSYMYIVK